MPSDVNEAMEPLEPLISKEPSFLHRKQIRNELRPLLGNCLNGIDPFGSRASLSAPQSLRCVVTQCGGSKDKGTHHILCEGFLRLATFQMAKS